MTTLTHIKEHLEPELKRMNAIIADTLRSDTPLMNSIVERYLTRKGKQLRPMLVLLSGQLFGQVDDRVLYGGAAVELLHNASLIHDDVIDQARQRRGSDTINHIWANHVAVLVGDYFISAALRCAVKAVDPRVLDELAGMGRDLSLGEITQIDNARQHGINEATYFDIIDKKTASLFESCVAVGGFATNVDSDSLEPVRKYARLLGEAFQIKDDTFDYFDDPAVGKPTGNDLREGKVSLPLIYALRLTDHPEHEEMNQLAKKEILTGDDIDRLVDFAKRAGGIDYAYDTMQRLRAEADRQLDRLPGDLPGDPATVSLREIFEYIIIRKV